MKSKHLLILSLLNICFIVYLTFSGSKYAINLMEYDEAYSKLIQIDGVGHKKATEICNIRQELTDVSVLDTDKIKYSRYFTVRCWDMRTDLMLSIFIASIILHVVLCLLIKSKGIVFNINKYIQLFDKEKPNDK